MRNGALRHTGSSSLSSASTRNLAWTPTVASCSRARARLRVGVVSGKRGSISTSPSLPASPGRSTSRGAAWQRPLVKAQAAATGILPLGFDLLTFLGSTVVVVPLFKKLKISPVLGFLLSGVVLHQLGLIRDPKDMEALSELGVLFLLFEMGLELSLDRLKALAKFAFGLGTLQMVICTGIFTAFALPAGSGLGTKLLETLAHAPTSLVSIRSVDEAVVIGGALSMSSSAFVLQLLTERGEMPTRFGSATLGILLLQDIAIVPFLVLLPLAVQLKTGGGGATEAAAAAAAAAAGNPASLVALLGPTAAKTCAGLGLLLVGGRLLLRRVFEMVAKSDNSETFVALCLLTVAGAALLTESLGFSDTMGAFVAGVLLSESSYKTQVEADIRPFRGLLLGLFFVTTGGSINMEVLRNNWEVITWILVGLITVKTSVVACLGPWFGLKPSESIRTGFMLSQGGEFAFVLLSLASSLHVLPENLNQVLIIVVVMSMALTPGLAQCGKVAGEFVENMMSPRDEGGNLLPARTGEDEVDRMSHGVEDPVVICGFGPHGQMLAALLDQPLASLPDPTSRAYIAFDLNPSRVQAAREAGFNVVYGDGSRAAVLKAAGVVKPRALAVCLTSNMVAAHRAVAALRTSYPNVPIFALGQDIREAAELEEAGADRCLMSSTNVGLALGTEILSRLGASVQEAAQVGKEMEEAMTLKAHNLAEQVARYGTAALETEETSIVLHGRTSYVTRGSSTMARNAANNGMQVVEVMMSTPAPPDSLPSMAEAMPSFVRKSMSDSRQGSLSSDDELSFVDEEVHQPALVSANGHSMNGSLEGSADEGALELQGTQRNGHGGGHSSSNGNGHNGSSKGSAKKMIRNRIAGTATARYDCASDDDECKLGNEVAGMVLVDASKQQLQQEVVEAAVRADAAAAAREARRRSPVAARTGESLPGTASYYDEQ